MPSPSIPHPDAQSRFIIKEFMIQTGIGLGLIAVLFVTKAQTLAELGHVAVRIFSFYSVMDCVRASVRREPVWGLSLNRWDQAAAYALCATFCSLLLEWPA